MELEVRIERLGAQGDGVRSVMPGLVPGIHEHLVQWAWIAGTSPAMTN